MTRHKHYDVIVAYAEGKQIQWRDLYSDVWVDVSRPVFLENLQYRVKPEEKNLCLERSDNDFLRWVGKIEKVEYVKPTSN